MTHAEKRGKIRINYINNDIILFLLTKQGDGYREYLLCFKDII